MSPSWNDTDWSNASEDEIVDNITLKHIPFTDVEPVHNTVWAIELMAHGYRVRRASVPHRVIRLDRSKVVGTSAYFGTTRILPSGDVSHGLFIPKLFGFDPGVGTFMVEGGRDWIASEAEMNADDWEVTGDLRVWLQP